MQRKQKHRKWWHVWYNMTPLATLSHFFNPAAVDVRSWEKNRVAALQTKGGGRVSEERLGERGHQARHGPSSAFRVHSLFRKMFLRACIHLGGGTKMRCVHAISLYKHTSDLLSGNVGEGCVRYIHRYPRPTLQIKSVKAPETSHSLLSNPMEQRPFHSCQTTQSN